MQLDTGVNITTIRLNAWTRVESLALYPYRSFCVNVSGQKINTSEFFNDILRCKENFTKGTFLIVLNRPYIALISAQIIDELNLKYDCGIIGNQSSTQYFTVKLISRYF